MLYGILRLHSRITNKNIFEFNYIIFVFNNRSLHKRFYYNLDCYPVLEISQISKCNKNNMFIIHAKAWTGLILLQGFARTSRTEIVSVPRFF